MRILILIAIIYFTYRALKKLLFPPAVPRKKAGRRNMAEIDDVMIKDPYCQVYFPKRNGVRLREKGKDLFFCSNECKDNYIASRGKK